MSKVNIKSIIKSKNNKDYLIETIAIKKDNLISYKDNDIITTINILKDNIIITRNNNNIEIELVFKNNESIIGKYTLKELNKSIDIKTYTKSLIIENNNLLIEYDLYLNNEYNDTFIYNIEWS